jgi:hypothetical protein
MSSKPKKAAPEKAASKATATPKAAPSTPPETRAPAAAVGGADRARINRLIAAGYDVDRCDLLGIPLDIGPRANRWRAPVRFGDEVLSAFAVVIIESAMPPGALELAAARLRERGGRP